MRNSANLYDYSQNLNRGVGGGVLRISSDGDDRRIVGGFEIFIPGFFGIGKFGKYFFRWLDLSRDYSGYSE